VLVANEVLDPAVLRWAAAETAAGWELTLYVDSDAGVRVLRDSLSGSAGGIGVFVEMGYANGRTGCRNVDEAVRLAAEVTTVDGARLIGVAGFEGTLLSTDEVHDFLDSLVQAAVRIAPLCPAPLVLSAGGSRFFDSVVKVFGPPAREHGWRVLLRSGCYLSHDHGFYAEDSPFVRDPSQGVLHEALEVWAQVLSTPEPALALLGAGKRDLPYDLGLPVALEVRGVDGVRRDLSPVELDALNDQHAYLRGVPVAPGELVKLGISHPCTAFDKWRTIPVVDDDYRVTDLLRTYF
jgi:D-serine deaminase-like pyridoxal phosphate-dependent protein